MPSVALSCDDVKHDNCHINMFDELWPDFTDSLWMSYYTITAQQKKVDINLMHGELDDFRRRMCDMWTSSGCWLGREIDVDIFQYLRKLLQIFQLDTWHLWRDVCIAFDDDRMSFLFPFFLCIIFHFLQQMSILVSSSMNHTAKEQACRGMANPECCRGEFRSWRE